MRFIPYDFVLEELAPLRPWTRPMFGCTSVYVGEKIVFILRDKEAPPEDKGVWIATTEEHHASLRGDFPQLRSIALFGDKVTGWQVLPENEEDFEESVLRACAFVRAGDARIGKVPQSKLKRRAKKKSSAKNAPKQNAPKKNAYKTNTPKKKASKRMEKKSSRKKTLTPKSRAAVPARKARR